jgi:ribose transport system substrate-binding protein
MAIMRNSRTYAALATLTLVLSVAACGSSSSNSKSTGSAGQSGGNTAGGGGSGIDVAGAQAFIDKYKAAPQSLGLPALSKKPPAGKYLITLETPQPVASQKDDAIAKAASLLGWKYERIQVGADADSASKAFSAALQRHPDAVHFSGTPAALVTKQLQQAKSQGVVAISDSNTDTPAPPVISTSLDSTAQVTAWGQMAGAYIVATTQKKTRVAILTIQAYPILTTYTNAVRDAVKKYCSSCQVDVINQQISDVGQKTPGAVVSTLQQSPDTKWVVFAFGDMTLGVSAALRAAGLQDKAKITGDTPSPANLQAIRDGKEDMWPAFPTSILGWRVVDMLARHFVGDDLTPANNALMPTQILTHDTIGQAVFDQGLYVGFKDYQDQFKKLWQVG